MIKITQTTDTYLEAVNKQTASLVLSPILIIGGIVVSVYLKSTPMNSVPWWVGLIISAVGIVILLFYRSLTIQIDKQGGKITIASKGLFKGSVATHEVTDVEKIILFSQYEQNRVQSDNGMQQSEPSLQTSLFLVLRNGQRILMANGTATSVGNGIIGATLNTPGQAEGQKIADFLSVPFENSGTPTLQTAVSAIGRMMGGQK